MPDYRKEKDLLGERDIKSDLLYGIHTKRALENFPLSKRTIHPELIKAYGAVKLACAKTNYEIGKFEKEKFESIKAACAEVMVGHLNDSIVVDALQGGAGTSTNMNINEVIANKALNIMGHKPGQYDIIHPIEDVNLHQSTNDTYPTALKIGAIHMLRKLEEAIIRLLEEFQKKEKEMAHIVKVGRTQMQDAVLTTMGRTMAAYAEALGRDRWRIYKCEERLRVVNLGGTAIGTGLSAPRKYIFKVVDNLKDITGIGLARSENLVEATQNNDVFVEVSGIINACASNLLKIASDLRFMSSGPISGIGELILPERQAGSSIMPGKVNPVIPEAVSQAAMVVNANHVAITQACSMGNLELNPFLPLIADKLFESLELLVNSCTILLQLCIRNCVANEKRCKEHVFTSTAVLTALISRIGYEHAESLIAELKDSTKSIKDLVLEKELLSEEEFDFLISPESVTALGSR